MAVTIHQTPDSYTPSDNPVVWVFSSDQTAQNNFYYLIKVYVNDVQVGEEVYFPESGIYSRFDGSAYTSNACGTPAIGSNLLADAENYCEIRITVVERYGDPVADGANAAAANIVAWKAKMTDEDFVNWSSTGYVYGDPGQPLTSYPDTPKVRREDEDIRLLFINGQTSITAFKVELFDANDVSIVSDTLNFTATSYWLLVANVSPAVIIASALAITSANFDSASYYKISANAGAGFSEYQIDLNEDHYYDHRMRVHFMADWGDIASYSFDLFSKEMGDIQSWGYQKTWGSFSGNSYVFTTAQGQYIDYVKRRTPKMEIVSNWLTEAMLWYLNENLLGNPLVFIQDPNEASAPLKQRKVTNSAYTNDVQENTQVFLLVLRVDLNPHTSMII